MHVTVHLSLRSLLLQRIYPANITLIRNDSEAAKLVYIYVKQIEKQVEFEESSAMMSLEDTRNAMFKVRPLVGLSEGSIRKYISELWQAEYGIKGSFEIRTGKFDVYDERQSDL